VSATRFHFSIEPFGDFFDGIKKNGVIVILFLCIGFSKSFVLG